MSTTTAPPKLKRKSAMLNLFVSPKEINKLKADLQLRQNRKATPLPSTDPAPAAPAPEPTPAAPADSAPAQPPPPEPTPWTTAEDIALLHLKAESKPLPEIATSLSPRTEAEIETRWKEIGLPATTTAAAENTTAEATPAAETTEPTKPAANNDTNDGSKGPKGGNKQKGNGGQHKNESKQKNKHKNTQGKGTPPPTTTPPAEEDTTFTDILGPLAASPHPDPNNEAILFTKHDQKVRGILKHRLDGSNSGSGFQQEKNITVPPGATNLNGRPIIYIEENDVLGVEEVASSPCPIPKPHLPLPSIRKATYIYKRN
ncbi:MAG: hypothetical protein Q9178_002676 [Gyalolechia marmorata]